MESGFFDNPVKARKPDSPDVDILDFSNWKISLQYSVKPLRKATVRTIKYRLSTFVSQIGTTLSKALR